MNESAIPLFPEHGPNRFHQGLQAITRQDWIRRGFRFRLLRSTAHWSKIRPCQFECNFFGHRYRGDLSNHIDWHVFFFGAYELEELHFLENIANFRNEVVLDIGANVGQHSLFLSEHYKQVHAFEPYQPVCNSLEEKLRLNGVKNVRVHPFGLGEKPEKGIFFVPPDRNRGLGAFHSRIKPFNTKTLTLVIENGDDSLREIGIENIDVIKLDVEGMERAVLAGLNGTINKSRPIILMEFGAETRLSFRSKREFYEFLPANYSVFQFATSPSRFRGLTSSQRSLQAFDFHRPGGNIVLAPNESDVLAWSQSIQ